MTRNIEGDFLKAVIARRKRACNDRFFANGKNAQHKGKSCKLEPLKGTPFNGLIIEKPGCSYKIKSKIPELSDEIAGKIPFSKNQVFIAL